MNWTKLKEPLLIIVFVLLFIIIVVFSKRNYCKKIISTNVFLAENSVKGEIVSLDKEVRTDTILYIEQINHSLRVSFEGKDNNRFKRIVELGDVFIKNKNSNVVTILREIGDNHQFKINKNKSCYNLGSY